MVRVSAHLSHSFAFSTGVPREDALVARQVPELLSSHPPYISPAPPLYLPSFLHLPYLSPVSPAYLPHISPAWQVRELLSSHPEWPLTFDEQRAFVGVRCPSTLAAAADSTCGAPS